MRPAVDEAAVPTQRGNTSVNDSAAHRFNAVKHGFYRAKILLPGEDAEAYRRERLALFHTYRPQTVHEAQLLDTMAEWQWQLKRSSPLQARFDEQALEPAADAAGRVSEPLAHRRLHSTMDVTLHRQRIDRAVNRAHGKLMDVQKLRRLGLVEGAVKLPQGCYMECSGEVVGPVVQDPLAAQATAAPDARQESTQAAAGPPTPSATGSKDTASRESGEQKENPSPPAQAAQPPRQPASRSHQDSRGRLVGGLGAHRIFLSGAMAPPPVHPPATSSG